MKIVLAKAETNAPLPMSGESHQLELLHYPVMTAAAVEALVGLTWLVAVVADRRLALKTVLIYLLLIPMACWVCFPTAPIYQ